MASLTTAQRREIDRTESLEALREYAPTGTTVYAILRHVSRSGMLRHISFVIVRNGEIRDITWHISRVAGFRLAKSGPFALQVPGAGMDMGFHVTYTLASALHGDGYMLESRWL